MKYDRAGRLTRYPAQAGLSVIELLIILAVLAVIVLVSVPGSAMLLHSYRLKSASSDLVSGLNLARSEAIRRASTVRVCPSSNGRFCRDDGRWSDGWLVYSDGNGDGAVQEIELLQSYTAPDTHVHIIARGAAEKSAAFTVSGLVRENGSKDAEFILCHDGSDADSRTVNIDPDGWVSLVSDANPACAGEQSITG